MAVPAIVTQPDATDSISYIGASKIPIRNIWLLMLYASDLYRHTRDERITSVEENPDDIADLVAEILAGSVERRIKRNMSFDYQSKDAVLNRLRGHVDLLRTERSQLLRRGKIACRFDELTIDTPRNRFVRAALARIAKSVHRSDLARRCRILATTLARMGVSSNTPHRNDVSINSFGHLDAADRQMVAASRLAFDLALPNESDGSKRLSKPYTERQWWELFEKAVAGFYKFVLENCGWYVRRQTTKYWPVSTGNAVILPSMRPDIILDSPSPTRRVVVDTKFKPILHDGKINSADLYQIYAYLRSQEDDDDSLWSSASGILLHPVINDRVDESVTIQRHEIRFATVDLAAKAAEIRKQLLQAIDRRPPCQPT